MRHRFFTARGGPANDTWIPDQTLPAVGYLQRRKLDIPTYEGSSQATEPSIVKIPGGWNGWIYWMAMVPYPFADGSKENPSILVSNDGFKWTVPSGLTNPIHMPPSSTAYSDPDLVFYNGTLYLYHNSNASVSPVTQEVVMTSSTDGLIWTALTTVLQANLSARYIQMPNVIRDANGTWKLWTIDINPATNKLELWTATDPAGPFTGPTSCTAVDPEGRDLFHGDIYWDGSSYRMVMSTTTLGASTSGRLELGSSADGISWSMTTSILSPSGSAGLFDGASVYRPTTLLESGRYRVWYGADDAASPSGMWSIGYTEVNPASFP